MEADKSNVVPNNEAVLTAIRERRARVIDAVKAEYRRVKAMGNCDRELAISERAVMCQLFDIGHKDPAVLVGANFVAWHVDRHLWQQFERLASARPFPFENDRPDAAQGPGSGKLYRYQRGRLAREASRHTDSTQLQQQHADTTTQPLDATVRLDQRGLAPTRMLDDLSRFPEPLRDADVVACGGRDASGLIAALIVLRQVYKVLVSLQIDASAMRAGANDQLRAEMIEATRAHREALDALRKSESKFSLLATAWLPRDPPSAVRTSQETLDAFVRTWEGSLQDLSFASILSGDQAQREVWSHERFSFFCSHPLAKRADELWDTCPALSAEDCARESLLEFGPETQQNFSAELESRLGRLEADGRTILRIPNHPSVLRIRYTPSGRQGWRSYGLHNIEFPVVRMDYTCDDKERLAIHTHRLGPEVCGYKLFAAVRLRNGEGEPDLVSVFDLKTPERVGPYFPLGTTAPFAASNWRPGSAGHQYDLFYCLATVDRVLPKKPQNPTKAQQLELEAMRDLVRETTAWCKTFGGPGCVPQPLVPEVDRPAPLPQPQSSVTGRVAGAKLGLMWERGWKGRRQRLRHSGTTRLSSRGLGAIPARGEP